MFHVFTELRCVPGGQPVLRKQAKGPDVERAPVPAKKQEARSGKYVLTVASCPAAAPRRDPPCAVDHMAPLREIITYFMD